MAHALAHPTHGAQRVADELMLRDVQVSSGESVSDMQVDRDAYLEAYKHERPHPNHAMQGRTPH